MCGKFQQKQLNCGVVGAPQSFSDNIPGFPKTIELCPNFCMGFYIIQLELSNYGKSIHKKTILY